MTTPGRNSESANQPAVAGPSHGNAHQARTNNRTLNSLTDEYIVLDLIGKGSFGLVYKCSARYAQRTVAIKVLRDKRQKFIAEREFEICLLFSGTKHFVEVLDYFDHKDRPCLVFELLEESLYSFITKRGPLPIKTVRPLVQQLLEAAKALKGKNIVHGDLKPVNIMLKNRHAEVPELKIIDMGGAMNKTECSEAEPFQTLHFRAPEVILRAPCSENVDLWSIGCIVCEMLLGRRVYPGKTPRDQLIMITKCQGALPNSVLRMGLNTMTYYNYSSASGFTLKGAEYGLTPESWNTAFAFYTFDLNCLEDVTKFDKSARPEESQQLMSLLNMMMNKNSIMRCMPEEALSHEFFKSDENSAK